MDLIEKVLEKIQDNAENVETALLERGKLPYIAKRIAKKYDILQTKYESLNKEHINSIQAYDELKSKLEISRRK